MMIDHIPGTTKMMAIVKALRRIDYVTTCDAADLIEAQAASLTAMRNELCQLCGKYQVAYLGACDGCRWKEEA